MTYDSLLYWLEKHLLLLNVESSSINDREGYTRLGYSKEELQAMDVFESIAQKLHMTTRKDEAGNRIARWEGQEDIAPFVLGSHIDTVINGGAYDGVAGILCALAAVYQLQEEEYIPIRPIEIICFASEESSRFGISTIGSEAMSGLLNKDEIAYLTDEEGITLKEAIIVAGLDWETMQQAERPTESIYKFLELHIEQGEYLQRENKHFGIVTAIACPIRYMIEITGEVNHSGTTRMHERKDALVAASELVTYVYHTAQEISSSQDNQIVATVGTFNVFPNATTSIPGYVDLGIDIRSVDDRLKEILGKKVKEKLLMIERTYNVKSHIEKVVDNPSVNLDADFTEQIQRIGEELGYPYLYMESGAGHDVMNMATKWPAGLIFIPCKDGISHNPKEYTSLENLARGTSLLKAIIQNETGA